MKKHLILVAALLTACGSQGGNNGGGGSNLDLEAILIPLPSATTPVGKEASSRVVKFFPMIGPEGGTLTSEDGRLALVVPPGAVADLTDFGLQLIENQMPSGLGLAYRIAAKNINTGQDATLALPLGLEVTLDGSELSEIAPENLLMAHQGAGGRWQIAEVQTQPITQAGTGVKVKAALKKPGDYAVGTRYKLHPARGSVKVNGSLLLTVLKFSPTAGPDLTSGFFPTDVTRLSATAWAVNGVAGGNSSVGLLIDEGNAQKRYKAPAKKPTPNPVKVTAQVNDGGKVLTVASQIQVEESKGWINVYADVLHRENLVGVGSSKTLKVDANAQYQLAVTQSFISAPGNVAGNPFPGIANYQLSLSPGASATVSIKYKRSSTEICVCAPNPDGKIHFEETFEFTAADTPKLLNDLMIAGEVKSDGSTELKTSIAVKVEGDYTYHFTETYTCGDRPPRLPVDKNGKAEVVFAPGTVVTISGKVKPQGPDRIVGTGSYTMPVQLPDFPFLPRVKGTFVPNWYFAYEPSKIQSLPHSQSLPASVPNLQWLAPMLEPRNAGVKPQC